MRNYGIGIALLCLFNACIAQKTNSIMENDMQWILDDLVKKWEGTGRYTLGILEAMPAKDYDFKPTEEVMTFKEQIEHIHKWMDDHIKRTGHEGLPVMKSANKSELMESVRADFDTIVHFFQNAKPELLKEKIKMWYGESSKLRLLHLMDNHVAHHRGQMIIYLRMKGIKPPRYIGW